MRGIEPADFAAFRLPGRLRAGQNGTLAYLLRQADLDKNRYMADIWLYREGHSLQLTSGGNAGAFWWQGEDILFHRTTKPEGADKYLPQTVLWRISTTQPGEAQMAFTLEGGVEDIAFLPDGRLLYLAAWNPAAEAALEKTGGDRDAAAKLLARDADVEVIDELPFWDNGGGFKARCRTRLYLYADGEATALTDEQTDVELLRLSPDGSTAYFTASRFEGVCRFGNQLFMLDAATGRQTDISLDEPYLHEQIIPLPTGEVVVFGNSMREYGINQNNNFTLLQPETGRQQVLDDSGLYACWSSVGTDLSFAAPTLPCAVGTDVYWVSTLDTSSHLMRLSRDGSLRRLTRAEGAVQELAAAGGALYFTALRGEEGPELYRLEPNGGEARLTGHNEELAARFAFTAPHRLDFRDGEGHDIHGFVYEPPGREAGTLCPAVLYIHGGPKTVYGPVAFHEMQLLASRGYAVLLCNPAGSDGQGDDFADIRGRWGLIDYENLMTFVDLALAQHPWIDGLRLGVCGGSYGGHMVNWIVGHTHRFKAAVSQRGIANWVSMQLLSDIGPYFVPDQTGTDLWHDPKALWEQSPLCYAPAATTPTLFLHSDEDYRCPLPEGMQMYAALRSHGVDARLVVFRGENHDLSRTGSPHQRVRRLEEILAWLEKYL